MSVDESAARQNWMLRALRDDTRAAVLERSDVREFDFRELVYEQSEPIERVIFPLDGVFSLISLMDDGRGVEIATVGNEGFVGLPVFLQAARTSAHRAIAQIPGRGLCLTPVALSELAGHNGDLQGAMLRYAQTLITQIAQGSACNRLHSVEQRCTRWLLLTHDRVGRDEFPLTQDFLGQMLGVGRPAVNAAARTLQDAGLIRYSRGRITILDRAGLEAASCECYAVIRDELRRLLSPRDGR
jgi:CRP-like cAMP-binding protein